MNRFGMVLFMSIVVGNAQAASPCSEPQTTQQMLECSGLEFKAADAWLNASYSKLLKLLDDEGKQKLKSAQKAWLIFRDANSIFAGDLNRGGSAEGINIVGAKTDMTQARAKELDDEIKARQ